MEKINAVITGVGGYVPDYVLTNDEISRMVDTNDEWIMTRIGVKERRILNEEGLGSSYMARKAAKQLMQRTGADPDDIDLVIVATSTPDYHFPSTASILCDKLRLKNAYAFDLQAACSGFLYLMETAANFSRSGRYKKVIIVGADKMSSMVDYTDRATCPIFDIEHLTTYVARHTFATVLKRSGVNIAIISESLGHSDLSTTQIYLDSFENSQIDAAMQNLL